MNIWMIAREYAGIAEAGGVKNVVCSLSEELENLQNDVTLFIPEYGCTNFSSIHTYKNLVNLDDEKSQSVFQISVADKNFEVSFAIANIENIKIVFVKSSLYKEKFNIYTYCQKDLARPENAGKIAGNGYDDWLYMDILFQKAICVFAKNFCAGEFLQNKFLLPEVVHCHDACVAVLPALCKVFYAELFSNTKFIVSIHNAGPAYHHEFLDLAQAHDFTNLPLEILEKAKNGARIEPYVLALDYSKLSTVSFDYATELLDPNNQNTDGLSKIFASRKNKIFGITNGIDTNRYLPEDKNVSLLPFEFSPINLDLKGKYECRKFFIEKYAKKNNQFINFHCEKILQSGFLERDEKNENIYISFHGRLVRQKGILVILDLFEKIFAKYKNVRFIINGQGETFLQDELCKKANQFPGKILYLCGYEKSLARLCTAVGDFALFPSDFEPCGLEDFIAQIYGTIPVAHATGGLKKIIDAFENPKSGTGFLYSPNTSEKLFQVLSNLIDLKIKNKSCFDEVIKNAAFNVKEKYNWRVVVKEKYLPLFQM